MLTARSVFRYDAYVGTGYSSLSLFSGPLPLDEFEALFKRA